MPKLKDLLPPTHPLRQAADSEQPAPAAPIQQAKKTPLFLTTTMFLSNTRTKVTQEYAGETRPEIINYLTKRGFSGASLEDLLNGFPYEPADKKSQFFLEPQIPKERLGDILISHKNTEGAMSDQKVSVLAHGWGVKLRELREATGKTQKALSKLIFKETYNVMSHVEAEKRILSPHERDSFFRIIGKPVDLTIPVASGELMKRRENPNHKKSGPKPRVKLAPAPEKPAATPKTVSKGLSAVKQHVLKNIQDVLESPKVSDAQANEILNLFNALTVSALIKR